MIYGEKYICIGYREVKERDERERERVYVHVCVYVCMYTTTAANRWNVGDTNCNGCSALCSFPKDKPTCSTLSPGHNYKFSK